MLSSRKPWKQVLDVGKRLKLKPQTKRGRRILQWGDFLEQMLGPSAKACWGGAKHVQIMATAIEHRSMTTMPTTVLPSRVIIHTKNTNEYHHYLPITSPTTIDSDYDAQKDDLHLVKKQRQRYRLGPHNHQWIQKAIDAGDVLSTDIVVVFSGCRWSPTKYDANVPRGDLLPPRSRFAATTKMVPLTLRLNYKQKNNHVWWCILLLTVIMMRRKMIFVLSKSNDGVTDSAATTINGFRKPSMQEMSCLLILWLFSVVVVGVLQSMMPMCHEGICFPSRSRFAATTKMVPLMLRLNYKQKNNHVWWRILLLHANNPV
jgi:hypothetical protein